MTPSDWSNEPLECNVGYSKTCDSDCVGGSGVGVICSSINLLVLTYFLSQMFDFLPLSCEYGGLIEVDRFEEIFNIGEGDVTSLSKNISEFIENFPYFS